MLRRRAPPRALYELSARWRPANRADAALVRAGRLALRAQLTHVRTKLDSGTISDFTLFRK